MDDSPHTPIRSKLASEQPTDAAPLTPSTPSTPETLITPPPHRSTQAGTVSSTDSPSPLFTRTPLRTQHKLHSYSPKTPTSLSRPPITPADESKDEYFIDTSTASDSEEPQELEVKVELLEEEDDGVLGDLEDHIELEDLEGIDEDEDGDTNGVDRHRHEINLQISGWSSLDTVPTAASLDTVQDGEPSTAHRDQPTE